MAGIVAKRARAEKTLRRNSGMTSSSRGFHHETGRVSGRLSGKPGGVVRPDHQLPDLDHFTVPRKNDQFLGLEGVEIGQVAAGPDGDGSPDVARVVLADFVERQPQGASGITRFVHYEHATATNGRRRAGNAV